MTPRHTLSPVIQAVTLPAKFTGLLNKTEGTMLFFRTRWGIHTFGMHYPIDVLILNKQDLVMKKKTALKPWRIFLWNPRYQNVLELPVGTIKKKNIKTGDVIEYTV